MPETTLGYTSTTLSFSLFETPRVFLVNGEETTLIELLEFSRAILEAIQMLPEYDLILNKRISAADRALTDLSRTLRELK